MRERGGSLCELLLLAFMHGGPRESELDAESEEMSRRHAVSRLIISKMTTLHQACNYKVCNDLYLYTAYGLHVPGELRRRGGARPRRRRCPTVAQHAQSLLVGTVARGADDGHAAVPEGCNLSRRRTPVLRHARHGSPRAALVFIPCHDMSG